MGKSVTWVAVILDTTLAVSGQGRAGMCKDTGWLWDQLTEGPEMQELRHAVVLAAACLRMPACGKRGLEHPYQAVSLLLACPVTAPRA